jgi:ubiquitin thioesterase protein OTUB1
MKEDYDKCTDQQIWDYEEKLKETEAEKQNYISDRVSLKQEYAQDHSVLGTKLKALSEHYVYILHTRRDGNCFYRAVGFLILQHIFMLPKQDDYGTLFVNRMEVYMESVGFQKLVYEDYIQLIRECLAYLSSLTSLDSFLSFFNQPLVADTMVILLRLTTSAYLRLNLDEFLPFIDELSNIDEFCTVQVENMGRDADHVHITALSKALDLTITIAYLDARSDGECILHEFKGESSSIFQHMYLLYRPGHYDILEKNEMALNRTE